MDDTDPARVSARGRLVPRSGPGYRVPPGYRVRSADVTPPGVHLANPGGTRSSAHGRPRSTLASALRYVGTTLAVFVLALLLVTAVEVVAGHPLSGGADGHTSLGDVLHPATP